MSTKNARKALLLAGLMLSSIILLWFRLPKADSPHYFDFADQLTLFGVPHAWDVLSNLGFFAAGIYGLLEVAKNWRKGTPSMAILGSVLSLAAILTCVGSAYFHWTPNPHTLIWDRIPMTIGFAAVAAMVVADRISARFGLVTLAVLVPFGLLTIIGYANGFLDLRPYMLLQFGSLIFILFTISIYRSGHIRNSMYSVAVFWYVLAKIFESYDQAILDFTGFVSGHTLKHLCASVAIFWLLTFYRSENTNHTKPAHP